MSSLKEELAAKRARLAELRRQRELRQEQYTSKRQSIGEVGLFLRKTVWWLTLLRLRRPAEQQKNGDRRLTT
jgi:hypothetical protein